MGLKPTANTRIAYPPKIELELYIKIYFLENSVKELLQTLPKVDEILKDPLFSHTQSKILKPLIQKSLQNLREQILSKTLTSFSLD